MAHPATTAVVFVLSRYLLTDADRCIQYCLAHGYDMLGLVKDDWQAAVGMLQDRQADVLVVADEEHLDPQRAPRFEVVSHQTTGSAVTVEAARRGRRNERTRVIRRSAAE